MQIEKCRVKTKCDMLGCKNLAEYNVLSASERNQLKLCDACAKELYIGLSKLMTPPSIPAPFKEKTRRKNG